MRISLVPIVYLHRPHRRIAHAAWGGVPANTPDSFQRIRQMNSNFCCCSNRAPEEAELIGNASDPHTHAHAYTHTSKHANIHMHIYTRIYVHTYTSTHTKAHVYTHTRIYARLYKHQSIYVPLQNNRGTQTQEGKHRQMHRYKDTDRRTHKQTDGPIYISLCVCRYRPTASPADNRMFMEASKPMIKHQSAGPPMAPRTTATISSSTKQQQ